MGRNKIESNKEIEMWREMKGQGGEDGETKRKEGKCFYLLDMIPR